KNRHWHKPTISIERKAPLFRRRGDALAGQAPALSSRGGEGDSPSPSEIQRSSVPRGTVGPSHEPQLAEGLPVTPPLPFQRGEGRREGSSFSSQRERPSIAAGSDPTPTRRHWRTGVARCVWYCLG